MMKSCLLLLCSLSLLPWFGACAGPRANVMSDADPDYVGINQAGAETYDRLIAGAVDKLLSLHSARIGGVGNLKVAVLGVENESGEELGDWHEQIYELIDTSINRSGRYGAISKRYVDAALRESRLRYEELFLPRGQRAFAAALERQGAPIDAFLFPKLTRGSTPAGSGITQRNYMLTLELVDIRSGNVDKVSERLRKEYRR